MIQCFQGHGGRHSRGGETRARSSLALRASGLGLLGLLLMPLLLSSDYTAKPSPAGRSPAEGDAGSGNASRGDASWGDTCRVAARAVELLGFAIQRRSKLSERERWQLAGKFQDLARLALRMGGEEGKSLLQYSALGLHALGAGTGR
ncbi:MAG: hypothetical protein ACE5F1_20230 [Planctomycetota bacterium]